MSDDQAYGIAAGELRQFIEQYEQLDAEKKDVAERQKELMAEAKARGYDTKVMRKIVALRKRDKEISGLWNTTSRVHSGANSRYHMTLGPCWFQLSLCLVSVTARPHSFYILVSARTWNVAWITALFRHTTLKRGGLADTQ